MTTYPAASDPVSALTRADGTTEAHSTDHGRIIGIWENIEHHGAASGGSAAANDAAIAAADTALGSGVGTIFVPPGRFSFSSFNPVYPRRIVGAGWDSSQDSTQGFGHSGWSTVPKGSVLASTATSGTALYTQGGAHAPLILENLAIIGPGSGTATGVALGTGALSSIAPEIHNVLIGNFSTGLRAQNTNELTTVGLKVRGCNSGMWLSDNVNQCVFVNSQIQWTDTYALRVADSTCAVNAFYGGLMQNCTGTILSFTGQYSIVDNFWFENLNTTTTEIELPSGAQSSTFSHFHIGSSSSGAITVGGARLTLMNWEAPGVPTLTISNTASTTRLINVPSVYFSVTDNSTSTFWDDRDLYMSSSGLTTTATFAGVNIYASSGWFEADSAVASGGIRFGPVGGPADVHLYRAAADELYTPDLFKAGAGVIGQSAALATNATDGFLYIPTCAGTPTGTPTAQTGTVPLIFDTSNKKLYVYTGGAWVGGTNPGAFT